MITKTHLISLAGLLAGWTFGIGAAHASDWEIDFNAAAGARYDGNVAIEDLETSSGEGDSVTELAAGGTIAYAPGDQPFALRLGYDYSGTSHRRFDSFDLDLHHGVAAVEFRGAGYDTALTFDRFVGVLDGADYVGITQVSPSIARLFGQRFYVRAAWIASTRDYETLPERDSKKSAGRIDSYVLLDGLDRYVSIGVQLDDETAQASEFDFGGYQVALRYAHTFQLPQMRMTLKSTLRYEGRDYAVESPETGETRADQRWRARLEAEVPFSEHVTLNAMLERTDNRSNLGAAELAKYVAGVELRLAF